MEETSGVSGASGASGAFGSIESTGSGDAPGRSVGEVALEMAVRFELRAPSGSVAGLAAPLQTSWTRLRRRSPSARSSTAASPKGRHEEAGDDGGATVVPLASRSVRSATGKVTERIGVKAPEAATDATGAAGATGGGAIGSHEADDEIARSAVGTRGTVSTNPRQAAVAEPTIEYEPSEARRHAIDERFVDLRADLEGAPPAAVAVATDGGAATRDESPCSPSTTAGRRSPPRSRRRASETHRAG
ncbi:MAG: hypothetical protein DWQ36_16180 [Acidobacteria bacterium]|nr:MAG: hypothetical protein DWQ36_16180 [Acidobacteriota bacterium]